MRSGFLVLASAAFGGTIAVLGCGDGADAASASNPDGGAKGGGDASPDSAPSAPDAAPDAAPSASCNSSAPFGAPTLVPAVNAAGYGDAYARLSSDELTIYFASTRPTGTSYPDAGAGVPGFHIFFATRANTTDPFGVPQPLASANQAPYVVAPTITADGLALYYSSWTGSTGNIFVMTRSTPRSFGTPTLVSLGATGSFADSYVSPDGQALYFEEVGSADIFTSTEGPQGFGLPQPLGLAITPAGGCNTRADQCFTWSPVISADGLSLYFASNRAGSQGTTNSSDVWVARRPTKADAFGIPTNVAELNSLDEDIPSWLSADGCRIYMARGNYPTAKIYMATRP
jgi:hypothetical protein